MDNTILSSVLYAITLSIFLATSDRYVLLIHIGQLLISLSTSDVYKRLYYFISVLYAILFLPALNNLFIWLWVSVSCFLQLLALYLYYRESVKDKRPKFKETSKKYGILNASVTFVNATISILTFVTKVNFWYLWIPYGLPALVFILPMIKNIPIRKQKSNVSNFTNEEQESLFGINGA